MNRRLVFVCFHRQRGQWDAKYHGRSSSLFLTFHVMYGHKNIQQLATRLVIHGETAMVFLPWQHMHWATKDFGTHDPRVNLVQLCQIGRVHRIVKILVSATTLPNALFQGAVGGREIQGQQRGAIHVLFHHGLTLVAIHCPLSVTQVTFSCGQEKKRIIEVESG